MRVEALLWRPAGQAPGYPAREVQISTESAKSLVRQVVDDWNKKDLDAAVLNRLNAEI